jgi:hypothetical protein
LPLEIATIARTATRTTVDRILDVEATVTQVASV